MAAYLDRRLLRLEAIVGAPGGEAVPHHLVGELVHLPAILADGEGDQSLRVAMRMGAGNEGVERFQPMH